MGKGFEIALSRFQKQKAQALARDEARKNALTLKQARALCHIGKLTREQKKRRAAQQPERLEAWVDAVMAWIKMSPRKRNQTPSPGTSDFGITNGLRAIHYLFKNITIE